MFLLIWFTFGVAARAATTPTCWTALGQVAPNDKPYYSENIKHSVCCHAGAICSANKLCILPNGGQVQRGSCTDRTWGRECSHFCLNEHSGDDRLTGFTMTICATDMGSTKYCCNDWTGRRCDCKNPNTPKVTLNLFQPIVRLAAEIAEKSDSGNGATLYRDIPWNTVGSLLITIMGICILSMLLYLARLTYITNRERDPTRNHSIMGAGHHFSECFWNLSLDEKGCSGSKSSIGNLDTEPEWNTSTKSV